MSVITYKVGSNIFRVLGEKNGPLKDEILRI